MAVKLALSLVVMSDTIVICLFVVFYAVSRGFLSHKISAFQCSAQRPLLSHVPRISDFNPIFYSGLEACKVN